MIYEYVFNDYIEYLNDPEDWRIYSDDLKVPRFPALFHASRMLRREGLSFFLNTYQLTFEIHDCDVQPYQRFYAPMKASDLEHLLDDCRRCREMTFLLHGRPHWQNLMRWCRTILEDGCRGFDIDDYSPNEEMGYVVRSCHDFVHAMRSRNPAWQEVESMLYGFRDMAAASDKQWWAAHNS